MQLKIKERPARAQDWAQPNPTQASWAAPPIRFEDNACELPPLLNHESDVKPLPRFKRPLLSNIDTCGIFLCEGKKKILYSLLRASVHSSATHDTCGIFLCEGKKNTARRS